MLVKISVVLVLVTITTAVDKCTTPQHHQGDCKPINECKSLNALLHHNRPISTRAADYLRRSQCGFEGSRPKVCCPTDSFQRIMVHRSTGNTNTASIKSDLLPDMNICGVVIQENILGGEKTNLDEFPWMALIEYEEPGGGHTFYCGGALISQRYVLTAAHCVKGKNLPKNWKLANVRLGEYNTATDPDCEDLGFGKDCAPSPITIPVEETIAHEEYDRDDANQFNDIALLRLKSNVTFNDFVKPICLPITEKEQRKSYIGERLLVAGWGETENSSESSIKLKVQVPVKHLSDCNSVYQFGNIQLSSCQMCVGGERDKDSCTGDSGGPLMALSQGDQVKDRHWFAAGVVSFGPSPCGQPNWPGVYTKVSKYLSWIVSKLQP